MCDIVSHFIPPNLLWTARRLRNVFFLLCVSAFSLRFVCGFSKSLCTHTTRLNCLNKQWTYFSLQFFFPCISFHTILRALILLHLQNKAALNVRSVLCPLWILSGFFCYLHNCLEVKDPWHGIFCSVLTCRDKFQQKQTELIIYTRSLLVSFKMCLCPCLGLLSFICATLSKLWTSCLWVKWVHAFVTSNLDYSNSLLSRWPKSSLKKP